jgi:hypothetical protein
MSDSGEIKRRINGLERPWHPFQMAIWVIFPTILAHYFAFLEHLLWRPLAIEIVLTILFSLFAIGAVVAGYVTMAVDPVDDAVLCTVIEVDNKAKHDKQTIHCYLCEKDVHMSSKHCRFCDKCVLKFDHHCKWLNTCVGQKNYVYFLCVVGCVSLLSTESLAISVALLVEAFAYPHSLMGRITMDDHLKMRIGISLSLLALRVLLVVSVAVLLGLVAMIYQLGTFHIVLLYRGITTYEFIVLEQKRLREKENQRLRKQVEMQQQQGRAKAAAAAAAAAAASSSSSSQSSTHIAVKPAAAAAVGAAPKARAATMLAPGETAAGAGAGAGTGSGMGEQRSAEEVEGGLGGWEKSGSEEHSSRRFGSTNGGSGAGTGSGEHGGQYASVPPRDELDLYIVEPNQQFDV